MVVDQKEHMVVSHTLTLIRHNMPKKYVHEDGTETILKVKHYEYDKVTFKRRELKKDFATLFVSVSSGCRIGCKLCFLTYNKDLSYQLLSPENIISNNTTICDSLPYNNIKISFMGMGEGVLLYKDLQYIAESIAKDKLYAVDIGTMLPFVSSDLESKLNDLKNGRLFFSLHSAVQNTRDKLISSNVSLEDAKDFMKRLTIKKVCHYTLIDKLNDTDDEIQRAIQFCKDTNAQLRILEFNKPDALSGFEPSKKKIEIMEILKQSEIDYKLCYSSGKRMKAACGMFSERN